MSNWRDSVDLNAVECPACHERSLPPFTGRGQTSVCCQNPDCLTVVGPAGEILGLHPDWERLPGVGLRPRSPSPVSIRHHGSNAHAQGGGWQTHAARNSEDC